MKSEPLASKIRPREIKEFIGQEHLLGEGRPLRLAIEKKHKFSFFLWGPPGCGKTTLARIYSRAIEGSLFELSAVSSGKSDIKKIIEKETGGDKVLFLDEIHRFNKAQQDYLLPFVESGELILIGATTENPSFEVIGPLLSRCKLFTLEKLNREDLERIIDRTGIEVDKKARRIIIELSGGDARQLISMVEDAKGLYGDVSVDSVKDLVKKEGIRYDKGGEEHYNTVSAFIKSMRAGQVDAALYYLAKMIEGGEDPKFIARRMVIFASEDIGQALPTALVVANEVFRAVEKVGLPEAEINLAHGTVYLSQAPKDRRSYDAYRSAQDDVKKYKDLPVPLVVRNASTNLMKDLGYGSGYDNYMKESFLPEKLKGKTYYPLIGKNNIDDDSKSNGKKDDKK
ncbi:MAG: replication-associated recombination protein A [Patescibacteria group bacterium]